MRCPYCHYPESRVLDSRPTDEGTAIRRRRECLSCGERFTTYEKVEEAPLYVVKKDGRRELFDPAKIRAGMAKACEKRPVPAGKLDLITRDIERRLRNEYEVEVTSQAIGELVMEELKKLDQVAFVRFASVYREFADVERFQEELEHLLKEKNR